MTLGLLILRVVVGLTLAAHGSQKLFGAFGGGGIKGTAAFFEQHLRFKPGKTYATMAGATEFGAGLALVLGLFTPLASAAVIGAMVVAGVSAHKDNGFFITRGGYEYTLILATAAATLAFVGPGRLSIDRALGWDLSGTVWGFAAIILGTAFGLGVLSARGRDAADETADETAVEGGREEALDRTESRDRQPEEAGA